MPPSKRKITSQSSTTSKKMRGTFYSNFVKTPFENRSSVRNSSSMCADVDDIIQDLISTPVDKWGKIRMGKFMSVLTTTHSIVADDGSFSLALDKYSRWAFNRPEIIELMDPHYILVNWGTVAPKPIADWNLTQAIIGARIPVPLPNASEVYALQSHDDAVLVQGNITTSFAGVHVFVVDSPHPLVSHVR